MRNIFLEKSCTNVVEKLFPDPFLKNQHWAYICINSLKFYTLLLLHVKLRAIKISLRPLACMKLFKYLASTQFKNFLNLRKTVQKTEQHLWLLLQNFLFFPWTSYYLSAGTFALAISSINTLITSIWIHWMNHSSELVKTSHEIVRPSLGIGNTTLLSL